MTREGFVAQCARGARIVKRYMKLNNIKEDEKNWKFLYAHLIDNNMNDIVTSFEVYSRDYLRGSKHKDQLLRHEHNLQRRDLQSLRSILS
jgi:hypothetical protein